MEIILCPKEWTKERSFVHSFVEDDSEEELVHGDDLFVPSTGPILCTKEFADEYSLMHYRRGGEKKGIRRWQNEDGSYTSAGREHYAEMYGWGNAPSGSMPMMPSRSMPSRPALKMQSGTLQRQQQTVQPRTANNLSGPVAPQFRAGAQQPNRQIQANTPRQPVSNAGGLNRPVLVRSNSNQPIAAANNSNRPVLVRNNANQQAGQQTGQQANGQNRPVLVRNNASQPSDQQKDFAWSARRVNAAGGLESREGRQIIYGNPTLNEDYKKQIAKRYGDSDGKSYPKSMDEKADSQNKNGQKPPAQRNETDSGSKNDSKGGKDTTGQFGRGNIDLNNRKVVRNKDGSISTERSFSVNIDGKETLLPTVVDGRIVSKDEAIDHYMRTGQHLGQFDTVEEADAYAEELHNRQDWYYNHREKDQVEKPKKKKNTKAAKQ